VRHRTPKTESQVARLQVRARHTDLVAAGDANSAGGGEHRCLPRLIQRNRGGRRPEVARRRDAEVGFRARGRQGGDVRRGSGLGRCCLASTRKQRSEQDEEGQPQSMRWGVGKHGDPEPRSFRASWYARCATHVPLPPHDRVFGESTDTRRQRGGCDGAKGEWLKCVNGGANSRSAASAQTGFRGCSDP